MTNDNLYLLAADHPTTDGGTSAPTIPLDVDLVEAVATRIPTYIRDDDLHGYVITAESVIAAVQHIAAEQHVAIDDVQDGRALFERIGFAGMDVEEASVALGAALTSIYHRALAALDMTAHTAEHDAIETQVRVADYWASQDGLDFAAGFLVANDRTGEFGGVRDDPRTVEERLVNARLATAATWLADSLESLTRNATTWWVSADMRDMATWAAASLPSDYVLRSDLPPSPTGFMVIDGGLVIGADNGGTRQVIRAVAWNPAPLYRNGDHAPLGDGIAVHWYVDRLDPRGGLYYRPLPEGDVPREVLRHQSGFNPGDRLGEWDGDVQGFVDADISGVDPGYPGAATNPWRWIIAAWSLLDTKVVVVRDHTVPRPYRRRAERARIPDPGTVRVVKMREADVQHIGDATEIEHGSRRGYSHRFFVRPHYRRITGRDGEVRHVPVVGYVKGPSGAPFIAKNVVYEWDR